MGTKVVAGEMAVAKSTLQPLQTSGFGSGTHLQLCKGIQNPLLASEDTRLECGAHTYMQTKTHKNKLLKTETM